MATTEGHDDQHHGRKPHESPAVVTVPLVLLAIPSVIIGFVADRRDAVRRLLQRRDLRRRRPAPGDEGARRALPRRGRDGDCTASSARRSGSSCSASACAWFLYLKRPDLPDRIQSRVSGPVPPARQQVLPRPHQRDRVRRRRAAGSARACGRAATWRSSTAWR